MGTSSVNPKVIHGCGNNFSFYFSFSTSFLANGLRQNKTCPNFVFKFCRKRALNPISGGFKCSLFKYHDRIGPTNFVRVMNKTDSLLILMTRNGSFKEQCGTDQIYTVTSYVQRSESSNILTKSGRAASSSANLYRSDVAILYNKLCI